MFKHLISFTFELNILLNIHKKYCVYMYFLIFWSQYELCYFQTLLTQFEVLYNFQLRNNFRDFKDFCESLNFK